MKLRKHDPNEVHVQLDWTGPFLVRKGKLEVHPLEPTEIPRLERGALYLIHGLAPLSNDSSLLYVGKTARLASRRIKDHEPWLSKEWRVEAFLAEVPDAVWRDELEQLLIYAHQPPYNSHGKASPPHLRRPVRLWNCGRYWGLHPEVSSQHEWNK